jgi:hypothetical protein
MFSPMPLSRMAGTLQPPRLDFRDQMGWIPLVATYIENGRCRLVSRKGNEFKSFPALNRALLAECGASNAVLDGEIVCLDDSGVSH